MNRLLHPSALVRAPVREAYRSHHSAAIAGAHAQAREDAGRWPSEPGPFDVPQPSSIARTLAWLMRDRGVKAPGELQGVTRRELEIQTRLRRNRCRSQFESFDDSLQAAIDSGWVVRYQSTTGPRYLPNYMRDQQP